MPETIFELGEIADDQEWDRLVESSPQGNIFSCSSYLRALAFPTRRFAVMSKGRVVAVCCGVEDESGTSLIAPDFTPYQGILFTGPPVRLSRQRILDQFRISEFLINVLTRRYKSIKMRLSWLFEDVRPFLWHNYHGSQAECFRMLPYYTATLSVADMDAASLLADIRSSRRQELRKASDYQVSDEQDIDKFIWLYEQTFLRQGIGPGPRQIALVRRIAVAALEKGFGRLSMCKNNDGIVSMSLFVFDSRRAYYLFGANNPAMRSSGGSTRLLLDNILHAQAVGLAEVDFVGVNSPQRGDFKLSFNPQLRLYFQADYGF